MAVEIGALRALLSLDSAAFEKGAKRAQASMNRLQRSMTQASERMRKVGRQMTTRVTLPLAGVATVAVRSSLKTVDAQAKMAQSLETSVVSLQNLKRASELAGISQSDLEGSLRRMTRRVSLAEQGTGAAVDALDQLNLSAADLADMPVDERVDTITSAIRDMVPAAEQAGVASQIFGDRTGLAMMRLDSDVISQAAREIDRFGVAVSDVDAGQIEEANDALSSVGVAMRGLANQLTVALAPALEGLADSIANAVAWFSDLSPRMQRMIAVGGTLAAAIGPLAIALGFVATGIAALASPIGLAVLAFGAAAGATAYLVTQWDDLEERFPILQRVADFGAEIKEKWSDLPAIKWALLIPALRWARFIPGLRWAAFIPKIAWVSLAGALKWGSLIGKLSWAALRVIPGIGWAALAGSLAWSALVDKIEWDGWIPQVKWAEWLTKINWSDWIPKVDWDSVLGGTALDEGGALSQMRGAGQDLGNGMAEGLLQSGANVRAAGAAAAREAEEGARQESQTESPSRKWMRLGRDLMDGLAIGISDNATAAADAAAGAAKQVTDVVERSQSMMTGFRDGAKTVFRDVLTRARSFRDSVTGVLDSLAGRFMSRGIDLLFDAVWPTDAPSFAGGGYTGSAPRTGGLDGKGGFPAILHPRETVVDHTKGGGGGTQRIDVRVYVDEDGQWQGRVEQIAGDVTQRGLAAYDRQLPGRVQQSLVQGRNRRQNKAWSGS